MASKLFYKLIYCHLSYPTSCLSAIFTRFDKYRVWGVFLIILLVTFFVLLQFTSTFLTFIVIVFLLVILMLVFLISSMFCRRLSTQMVEKFGTHKMLIYPSSFTTLKTIAFIIGANKDEFPDTINRNTILLEIHLKEDYSKVGSLSKTEIYIIFKASKYFPNTVFYTFTPRKPDGNYPKKIVNITIYPPIKTKIDPNRTSIFEMVEDKDFFLYIVEVQ